MFSSQVKAALAEDSNEQGGSKLILILVASIVIV